MTAANQGDRAPTSAGVPEPPAQGRIPADTFSNRLILAIHDTGLTIGEFSQQAGLDDASVSNWRKGMRPRNLVEVCQAIADAHGIDFNWLLLGGPLLSSRGRPTRRVGSVTPEYRRVAEWMIGDGPRGRPGAGTPTSTGRRPRQIDRDLRAAA